MKTSTHFGAYLVQFFIEWEMLQKQVLEKINNTILCPKLFFRMSYRLWDNVEKYRRLRRTTDVHIYALHAGYLRLRRHTHTHRICNTDFPLQQ